MPNPIVALALVTRKELDLLGPQFDCAYPIDETPCFGELLQAIDLADRQIGKNATRLTPTERTH